jgi:hypothetical protein
MLALRNPGKMKRLKPQLIAGHLSNGTIIQQIFTNKTGIVQTHTNNKEITELHLTPKEPKSQEFNNSLFRYKLHI